MFSLFSRIRVWVAGFHSASVSRDAAIFGMVLLLALLAGVLAGVDGYALYLSHVGEPLPLIPTRNPPSLSAQDIDGALKLLDEREEKVQALLGGA